MQFGFKFSFSELKKAQWPKLRKMTPPDLLSTWKSYLSFLFSWKARNHETVSTELVYCLPLNRWKHTTLVLLLKFPVYLFLSERDPLSGLCSCRAQLCELTFLEASRDHVIIITHTDWLETQPFTKQIWFFLSQEQNPFTPNMTWHTTDHSEKDRKNNESD